MSFPSSICFLNRGITDPLLPSTFPKRTEINFVKSDFLERSVMIISAIRLLAPITFVGFTALSVEIITNFLALCFKAISATI